MPGLLPLIQAMTLRLAGRGTRQVQNTNAGRSPPPVPCFEYGVSGYGVCVAVDFLLRFCLTATTRIVHPIWRVCD